MIGFHNIIFMYPTYRLKYLFKKWQTIALNIELVYSLRVECT